MHSLRDSGGSMQRSCYSPLSGLISRAANIRPCQLRSINGFASFIKLTVSTRSSFTEQQEGTHTPSTHRPVISCCILSFGGDADVAEGRQQVAV